MTPDQVRGRLCVQPLKRVFNIDMEVCRACGGTARVIACIEDPLAIKKILTHLEKKAQAIAASPLLQIVERYHTRVCSADSGIPAQSMLLHCTDATEYRLARR